MVGFTRWLPFQVGVPSFDMYFLCRFKAFGAVLICAMLAAQGGVSFFFGEGMSCGLGKLWGHLQGETDLAQDKGSNQFLCIPWAGRRFFS